MVPLTSANNSNLSSLTRSNGCWSKKCLGSESLPETWHRNLNPEQRKIMSILRSVHAHEIFEIGLLLNVLVCQFPLPSKYQNGDERLVVNYSPTVHEARKECTSKYIYKS